MKIWALGKAAGDSPRSPPPAAPFETNHCHLMSHLPQMWQERSSGSFSHKFLPKRPSRFPRGANTITALKTGSYNPEQNCFSAWARLGNILKAEECKILNKLQGPLMLRNWSASHRAMVLTADLAVSEEIRMCSPPEWNLVLCSTHWWLVHEHIFARGGKLL